MRLTLQLLSARAKLSILSARVSVNGTASPYPLRVGTSCNFEISEKRMHCIVHLEFFCRKSSGIVLPLGTTVVDLACEDLSSTPSRSIWDWDGGAASSPCGTCKLHISCPGSWTPLPDLVGLGFDKVLSGQLASTWARFGGAYSPIAKGIGLDNMHSPYYQQRVNLHGHPSALLPIRYWVESGTTPKWNSEQQLSCIRYYENACVASMRRRPEAAIDAISADVLMFPCRFVKYAEDRSPLDNKLRDTYQDPYIPGEDSIADCEDFSKIIQLSYFHLLHAAAAFPLVLSKRLSEIVAWLQKREIVIVQGAVHVASHTGLSNHVWTVLVEKNMLRYMLSPLGTCPPSHHIASLLLEGTSIAIGSGVDVWETQKNIEAFYAYTMALHVASQSAQAGDYELVRRDGATGVYAMPTALFFKNDWGNWRGLKVNATSCQQDKTTAEWMNLVEIPRHLPSADSLLSLEDIPLNKPSRPSKSEGVQVNMDWKLNF